MTACWLYAIGGVVLMLVIFAALLVSMLWMERDTKDPLRKRERVGL